MPAAGMEHGFNRIIMVPTGVPVMTTGAAAIVPRIIGMIVVGMETGIKSMVKAALVPVKMVGVAVIAQNPLGLPVSITGYGMQTQTISTADTVNVIAAGSAAIVPYRSNGTDPRAYNGRILVVRLYCLNRIMSAPKAVSLSSNRL